MTVNNKQQCRRDCLLKWHYGNDVLSWSQPLDTHGVPDEMLLAVPAPFNNNLWAAGECLIWRGELTPSGYPRGNHHRTAYMESRNPGEFGSNGGMVLHLCRRRFCVQPRHLYEGTNQDNVDDRRAHRGGYLRFDMIGFEGKRAVNIDAHRKIPDRWRSHWDGSLDSIPYAADCHHHETTRSMMVGDYCELCCDRLDQDLERILPPRFVRQDGHHLETPRSVTMPQRRDKFMSSLYRLASETTETSMWLVVEETLEAAKDVEDLITRLWFAAGRPQNIRV